MDFLNHREGGMVLWFSIRVFSFLFYCVKEKSRNCKRLKKYKSQGKAVEVTVNSKEENSYNFCLDYVQEFGLCTIRILPPYLWKKPWKITFSLFTQIRLLVAKTYII
jgi:hypothetical protein